MKRKLNEWPHIFIRKIFSLISSSKFYWDPDNFFLDFSSPPLHPPQRRRIRIQMTLPHLIWHIFVPPATLLWMCTRADMVCVAKRKEKRTLKWRIHTEKQPLSSCALAAKSVLESTDWAPRKQLPRVIKTPQSSRAWSRGGGGEK